MNFFSWHNFIVKLMKKRQGTKPWSDLEYELEGRNRYEEFEKYFIDFLRYEEK